MPTAPSTPPARTSPPARTQPPRPAAGPPGLAPEECRELPLEKKAHFLCHFEALRLSKDRHQLGRRSNACNRAEVHHTPTRAVVIPRLREADRKEVDVGIRALLHPRCTDEFETAVRRHAVTKRPRQKRCHEKPHTLSRVL